MTPLSLFDVPEVLEVQEVPSVEVTSEEVSMLPDSPTEIKSEIASTVNEVIVRVLLTFPAISVTIIVQFEYVPSLKETKVMVLFPDVAEVVLEEQ